MRRRRSVQLVASGVLLLWLGASRGASPTSSALAAPPSGSPAPTLRLSAIPDQDPEKLNRLYPLVAKVLSKQLEIGRAHV